MDDAQDNQRIKELIDSFDDPTVLVELSKIGPAALPVLRQAYRRLESHEWIVAQWLNRVLAGGNYSRSAWAVLAKDLIEVADLDLTNIQLADSGPSNFLYLGKNLFDKLKQGLFRLGVSGVKEAFKSTPESKAWPAVLKALEEGK